MIRLDCKIHSHEGEITVTTENILPYLGIIEEKTIGIISKYLKLQEMRQPLSSGLKLIDADAGGKQAHSGLHINPPKLVDYSSDEITCSSAASWKSQKGFCQCLKSASS